MSDMTPAELAFRLRRLEDKVKGDVERVGWSAISVFPVEGQSLKHPFTYTVGLTVTLEHPELIIYGLHQTQAHGMLACAIDLIRGGTRLIPGNRYDEVLGGGYSVEVREVPKPVRPLNMAKNLYGEGIAAVQIVWPDVNGIFPGEAGFNPEYEGAQDQHQRDDDGSSDES